MNFFKIFLILIIIVSIAVSAYLYIESTKIKAKNDELYTFIDRLKEERDSYSKKYNRYLLQDETAVIRNLNFLKPVDYETINNVELKNMIYEKAEKELAGEDESVEDYEKVLIKFGFLKPFDHIMPYITSVYSEQVQGMYNEDTGKMILVEGLPLTGSLQRMFMVHELTHALQDQHFDFKSMPIHDDNEDKAQAALALIEGDASLVMFIYYKEHFKVSQLLWDAMSYLAIDQSEIYRSPHFIRENLLFPYKWGVKFVMKHYAEGLWEKINQLFNSPPESTEQILHPEKYGIDKPYDIRVTDKRGESWREVDRNTLGEFNIRVLLSMYLGEYDSVEPSSGWGGDEWVLFENSRTGKLELIWETVWDTESDADEFFDACRKLLRKRHIPKARIQKRGKYVKVSW